MQDFDNDCERMWQLYARMKKCVVKDYENELWIPD